MSLVRLPPDWKLDVVPTPLAETIDWSLQQQGIPEIWQRSRGAGVRVAVLDTGADLDHPDLAGQIVEAKDFTRSLRGAEDVQGHGTWCCGHVAAIAGNDTGTAGIAPDCKLLVGKVLGDQGWGRDDWIEAGLRWAIEEKADIISMSFGGAGMSRRIQSILQSWISGPGRYPIAAAGNSGAGTPILDPAAWPDTIAVGAVDQSGELTNFSSRGRELDIVAPGYQMLSLAPGGRYARMSGTSMACPHVAGVAALALAAHGGDRPTLPAARALLQQTATKTTRDGYPLLDPRNLVRDSTPVDPPPGGNLGAVAITHQGKRGVFIPFSGGDRPSAADWGGW